MIRLPVPNESFAFGSFRLIPNQRILLDGGKPVRIGSRAMEILLALVERAGTTVSKDELMARAWPGTTVDDAALRVNIAALRKSLGDGRSGNRFVANIPGRGYVFVTPVTRDDTGRLSEKSGIVRDGDIPAPLSGVVGREQAIARLAEQLPRRRLVTIVGPGGIGKTTIAIAVANAVRDAYPNGVWFVALAPLSDPGLVASALSVVLNAPPPGGASAFGLAAWLRDKHALIVFDNCEHVIGAVAELAEALVASTPRVSVLATSREPLHVRGEWRHRVAPLELPPVAGGLATDEAEQYSAIRLFHERASADGFILNDRNLPAVVNVCRRLDGVPLALELAAAQASLLGIGELAARLDDRLVLLNRGHRTALPRHQTLSATLDWSYDLLREAERVVLRRLAVFRGSFTMATASAVCAGEALAAEQVIDCVARLVGKSLVAADISGEVGRYYLLDITRAYALGKLREAGEVGPVSRAHADCFRRLIGSSQTDNQLPSGAGHLIDNVRAALDWAFSPDGDPSVGIALAADLTPIWIRLSLISDCRRYAQQALRAIASGVQQNPRTTMTLNAALGASQTYMAAPMPETEAAWSTTLRLARELDDTENQLRALRGLWAHRLNGGEYRAALELANEFRSLANREADERSTRGGDRMASLILHYLGEQEQARELIAWSRDESNAALPSAAWYMIDQGVAAQALLARILWLQGLPDQANRAAETAYQRAAAADHAISRCHALAQAVCPMGLWTGDLTAADQAIAELNDLAMRNALPGWIARGKCYAGALLIGRGALSEGIPLLQEALKDLRIGGSVAESPFFLGVLAHGMALAGRIEGARTVIDDALAWCETAGEAWCEAELLRVKGEIVLLSDDPDLTAAEDVMRRSLVVARRQAASSWELRTAISLARFRPVQNRDLLIEVCNRFTEGSGTSDLRSAKALLQSLAPLGRETGPGDGTPGDECPDPVGRSAC
jgi:predicted ATPase/DNA-binding winged helix-turn-helix (wHTH) protein